MHVAALDEVIFIYLLSNLPQMTGKGSACAWVLQTQCSLHLQIMLIDFVEIHFKLK